MALSEQRRREIRRLTYEGGEDLTQAIALGEKEADEHLRRIHAEITEFLRTSNDGEELDFFAENWRRDGREWPIHLLIRNPAVDAGTLLRIYWYSDPEFYFCDRKSAAEFDDDNERDVFVTLEGVERRILDSDVRTASVAFDPEDFVTMRDRHPKFARPIPEVMFRAIQG